MTDDVEYRLDKAYVALKEEKTDVEAKLLKVKKRMAQAASRATPSTSS